MSPVEMTHPAVLAKTNNFLIPNGTFIFEWIVFILVVISGISPGVVMLFRFGFGFASVLLRILLLRGHDRGSALRYPS